MAGLASIFASMALSILGLGFLWIGKLSGEIYVALLYLLLAYAVSHYQGVRAALLAVLVPALPMALLIVQFRDPNDSHLGSIAIVLAWLTGMTIGAFAADRARTSLARLFICIGAMSLVHTLATACLTLASFGSAMEVFDGKPASLDARLVDRAADILMQPMLGLLEHGPGLSATGQWIAFGINSLAWGTLLGMLLAMALRAWQGPAPMPAG